MSSIMEQFTKGSGQRKVYAMVRVFKSGRMVASMRATGRTTWQTAGVDSFTLTATFTRESGSTTKLTAEAHTFTWMVLNIPVNGVRINNMGLV